MNECSSPSCPQAWVWGSPRSSSDSLLTRLEKTVARRDTQNIVKVLPAQQDSSGLLFTPSWAATAHEPVVSPAVLKRLQTGGNELKEGAFLKSSKYAGLCEDFGEPPKTNSYQFEAVFEDWALWKHGHVGQVIYTDPERDFVGVYFSTNGYISPYGEDKMCGYLRRAAKFYAGRWAAKVCVGELEGIAWSCHGVCQIDGGVSGDVWQRWNENHWKQNWLMLLEIYLSLEVFGPSRQLEAKPVVPPGRGNISFRKARKSICSGKA